MERSQFNIITIKSAHSWLYIDLCYICLDWYSNILAYNLSDTFKTKCVCVSVCNLSMFCLVSFISLAVVVSLCGHFNCWPAWSQWKKTSLRLTILQ